MGNPCRQSFFINPTSIDQVMKIIAILCSYHNPKRLKKRINIDLELLLQWLKANRIQLNVAKTEVVLFKSRSKVDYIHQDQNGQQAHKILQMYKVSWFIN